MRGLLDKVRNGSGCWALYLGLSFLGILVLGRVRTWEAVLVALAGLAPLLGFFLCGGAVVQRLGDNRTFFVRTIATRLPFTFILVGQVSAFCALCIALFLNWVLLRLFGASLHFSVVVLGAIGILFIVLKKPLCRGSVVSQFPSALKWTYRDAGRVLRYNALAFVGVLSVLFVLSMYGKHQAPFGLDTYSHLVWVREIMTSGVAGFSHQFTSLQNLYPRGFHILVALWTLLGGGVFPASFLKAMPYIQGTIACLAGAELLTHAFLKKSRTGSRAHSMFLAILWSVFIGVVWKGFYPVHDLNGTPRFSAAVFMYGPFFLFSLGRVIRSKVLVGLSFWSVPVFSSILLSLNPVLFLIFVTVVIPSLAIVWLLLSREFGGSKRIFSWYTTGVTLLLTLLMLFMNSWTHSFLEHLGTPERWALEGLGVQSRSQLVAIGQVRDSSFFSSGEQWKSACSELACYVDLVSKSFGEGVREFFSLRRLSSFGMLVNLPVVVVIQGGFVVTLAVFSSLLVLGLARVVLSVDSLGRGGLFSRLVGGRIYVGLLIVLFVHVFLLLFMTRFLANLGEPLVGLPQLLHGYVVLAWNYVGAPILWLFWVAVFWLGWDGMVSRRRVLRSSWRTLGMSILSVVVLFSTILAYSKLEPEARRHAGWQRFLLASKERFSLARIEAKIPKEDAVLANGAHIMVGAEHWIVLVDKMASALPYLDRKVVFEPPLRYSTMVTWEDFEDFCSKGAVWREQFLEKYRVNWTIVSDGRAARYSEKVFREPRFCKWKLSLEELGFNYPPVLLDGKFALFSRKSRSKSEPE